MTNFYEVKMGINYFINAWVVKSDVLHKYAPWSGLEAH